MNIHNLTFLLQHPEKIESKNIDSLFKVINDFPYFQSVRVLILKGLKKGDYYQYLSFLKKTAAHTSDRGLLYDYINPLIFKNVGQNYIKANLTDKNKTNDKNEYSEENKNIKKQELSFLQWLQLGSCSRIHREDSVEKKEYNKSQKTSHQKKQFDIIDNFIEKNPKISPKEDNKINDKSTCYSSYSEIDQDDEIMTETLAKIYLKQQKYTNAIQAYRILSLKYPEKNTLFAKQIKEIENLQKTKL